MQLKDKRSYHAFITNVSLLLNGGVKTQRTPSIDGWVMKCYTSNFRSALFVLQLNIFNEQMFGVLGVSNPKITCLNSNELSYLSKMNFAPVNVFANQ